MALQPVFMWFVWCWPCRRAAAVSGVALRGTPASPAALPRDGYTHEDSSRRSHRADVLRAPSEGVPSLTDTRETPQREPRSLRSVAPAATAPGSAAAGGAQGWAGPGAAPGNSLACWAGLRLPRRSGTWRCPWAGRRGGGECWESLTGAALTQEPVVQGPRQVCVSFSLLAFSPALGPGGKAQAKAVTRPRAPRVPASLRPGLRWRRVPWSRFGPARPGGTTPGVAAALGIAPVRTRRCFHC